MKLGELLVERRLITDGALQEALNSQLIYGGHLGTCLIEKGHLSERQLGEVLAETFDVPWATTECFESIPRFVIDTLSKSLVERHRAVPFRLEKNLLYVAMADPSDLRAIDEIGFATGRKIAPWIAPEVRLVQAMDRYYQVARRMRFVTLAAHLDGEAGRGRPAAAAQKPTTTFDAITAAVLDASSVGHTPVVEATPDDPLDALAASLCHVADSDKLGQAVLDHVGSGVGRNVLFQVRAGNAVVWDWRGFPMSNRTAAAVKLPITTEPLFALMMGDGHYRGPVPEDSRYDSFFKALLIDRPEEFVLTPAYADDRLVALLYCDAGPGRHSTSLDHDTRTYGRIARKLGLALNLIHIKRLLLTA